MSMKINKILLQLYLLVLFPFLTYADGFNEDYETYSRISGTINLGGVFTKGTMEPDVNSPDATKTDQGLISWGGAFGAQSSLFITDKIAFELFALANLCPINNIVLNSLVNGSSASSASATGSSNPLMIYIPFGAGLNFHPFPFGGIDPYMGLGGEYDLIFSTSNSLTPANAFTWYAKFGVSLIKPNNSIMSLEIKKGFLNHNITVTDSKAAKHIYKMILEPWIITFNFGYNL